MAPAIIQVARDLAIVSTASFDVKSEVNVVVECNLDTVGM